MYRILIALLLTALTSLALAGCGGGSAAPVPNAGDQTGTGDQNTADSPGLDSVIWPSQVFGSHNTSVLPDQLNVLTGATTDELDAQLARYGISVLAKSGGWATLSLPAGTDLDRAKTELEKEYNIARAEKINVLHTPRVQYEYPDAVKAPSYVPFDPMYPTFLTPIGNGLFVYPGQEVAMNTHGFEAAWDISLNDNVAARPCRIAIIGAGFWDFTTLDWPTFDETRLDSDVSAYVAGDGTATPGLDQVVWELYEDAEFDVRDEPYDDAASLMLGVLADDIGDPADQTGYFPRYFDFDGNGEVDIDPTTDPPGFEVWNVGAAGINPNAEFILIKAGQAVGDTWEYNDNEIAQAIKYAAGDSADDNGGLWPNGGCDADIILLSMFAEGSVGAVISNEVQTARDNNVLVIASAGDVIDEGTIGDPPAWVGMPVDIGIDPVTPASDPNVIAVSATGPDPGGDLGEVIIDSTNYTNPGNGWYPNFGGLLNYSTVEVATGYANTGGDIAAVGFGLGWRFDPLFQFGDGTEESPLQYSFFGYNYMTGDLTRFGSLYSAAYVAGAASIVHQILYEVNNLEPTDDEVWQIIADTVRYDPLSGVANNGGLLDAGAAAINAVNGGTLFQPSMYLDSIVVSQPPSYVAIESDFEITPTVQLGTAPFTLRVDWDNGEEEIEVPDWVNSDPVTLTGGWDTLGLKGVNLEIEDADGQLVTFALALHVTARLSVGISVEDVNGTLQLPTGDPAAFNIASGTSFRWRANPTNIYAGEIDGTPNETTFSWDFDGDGTEDATGVAPAYGYAAAGNYTLQLLVSETVRPDILFTVTVNAS